MQQLDQGLAGNLFSQAKFQVSKFSVGRSFSFSQFLFLTCFSHVYLLIGVWPSLFQFFFLFKSKINF